jgi:preprotein translocase subunit Sss1
MKDRKKIEQEILNQIRDIKDRLHSSDQDDSVPYDKDAARDTVQKFLAAHPDKEEFIKSLKQRMDS